MYRPGRALLYLGAALALAITALGAEGRVAQAATGPNGLIAYSSWDADLNYDIYTVDPALPAQPPVRLTTDGRYNSNPDWSPDGTKVVFDGWANFGGPRIQVVDTDPATDDAAVLSAPGGGYGDFQPAFSPNGTRIAFVSSRPNGNGTEDWGYEIYVMDAIGEVGPLAGATRLTTDVPDEETGMSIEDSQVTWSPDGSRIAFLSTSRGLEVDACDLWVMDSNDVDGDGFGDDLHQLTFDESFNCDAFEDVTPQWSPNSNLIAFTSVRTGYFDIWLVNANDPTDLRNVTRTSEGYEDQPSWSPDGTQVIFRSTDASGQYQMYSLPVPPPTAASPSTALTSPFAAAAARPRRTQLTHDERTKQHADWGAEEGFLPSTVTLRAAHRGHGRVSAPKIDCGRDCAGTFVMGKTVRLSATPGPGQRFKKWTGACAGTQRTCTIRLGKSKSVVAVFVPTS